MGSLSCGKNNMSTFELLQAQAHIWNHIFNFINSMSLKCAVELGIPEIIHGHGKPVTISELNNALSIHPTKAHCLSRLMRLLIHSGFFALQKTNNQNNNDEEEEEGYVLTNSSRLLLNDNPFSVKPFVLAMLDPVLTKPWHFASTWFLNDDHTSFDTAHGMPIWDYASIYPKFNNLFNEGMASDSRFVTSILINEGKEVFDGLSSIVDVGGGNGTTAKAIAKKFPHIECTVLDLPHVVDSLHDTPNLEFVAGNMFDQVPPADAILLKWILHDWSDEECVKILKQSKKAIEGRKEGKVIIIEHIVREKGNDNKAIETQHFFDMVMMMIINGKERNENEWAKLFSDAGFSRYKITPVLGLRSIIEVYP